MKMTRFYLCCAIMALFILVAGTNRQTAPKSGIARATLATTYNVSTVAELQTAVNNVNAGPGGDTIVLAPGLYALAGGTLFISRDVTIQGDDTSNTILDGGGGIILQTFTASITVRNLTFQNGSDAIISDSPGAFSATGITITGCAEGFNGGDSGGSSFFTNSTIANNTTGMRIDCESTTLTNVTVSDNNDGLEFSSCGEQMTINNSLIVRNTHDCSGSGITPVGDASFDSDGSCVAMGFGPGMLTKSVTFIDLGVLANNGGPTFTESISSPSMAINAGDNAICPATDQRGVPRSDGKCDIGAFEAASLLPLIKSQCMNNGWKNYARFKSQGDCVQFVNTGK